MIHHFNQASKCGFSLLVSGRRILDNYPRFVRNTDIFQDFPDVSHVNCLNTSDITTTMSRMFIGRSQK